MKIERVAFLLFAICFVALGGCQRRSSASVSIGTCNDRSIQCGIHLSEKDKTSRDLQCTPPDTKLPMSCSCVEGGQEKKRVAIASPLPTELDVAERFARDNCGW